MPQHLLVGTGNFNCTVFNDQIIFRRFKHVCSELFNLGFDLIHRLDDGCHTNSAGTRTIGAHAELHFVGIAVNDLNVLGGQTEPFCNDLCKGCFVALAMTV